MEVSGLRQQLEWVAVSTRAQMQARLGWLEAEERAAVDRVTGQVFGAERLQALVQQSLSAHPDEAKLAQALTWYRTPLGRKIIAAELVTAMPQSQGEIAAYVKARAANPPDPGRLERLRRLDETAGTTEFTFNVVLAVAEGLRRGVEPFVSVERARAMANADREVAGARPRVLDTLRSTTLVNSEFAYRSVSDGELDAYLAFLASPGGRWLIAGVQRALLHAIRVTTEEGIGAIAGVIPPQRWGRARPRPAPDAKTERL